MDFCESPPEFITSTDDVDIEWDEPIFHDNSRDELTIIQTHGFGRFNFGDTEVLYTAQDRAGNSAECRITVRLQRECPPATPVQATLVTCPTTLLTATRTARRMSMRSIALSPVRKGLPLHSGRQGTTGVRLGAQESGDHPAELYHSLIAP